MSTFEDKSEVESLLKAILPPVTPQELSAEMASAMKLIEDEDMIEVEKFLDAAKKNSYWEKAGPLVVKELILLDCLNAYYFEKRNECK